MTREEIRARIAEIGIIPAVRVYSESEALFAAEAVCSSGIPIVELTTTTLVPACPVPKLTVAPVTKFVPVIVTSVPPPVAPETGAMPVTVGVER